ncbi:hypothetical protein Salat_1172700 [Sesamum alatum]|uniref:Uncharacterized protein n=1 Tax=Sesamum alatum TaxID=300844 RepID=A0AAE1YFQ2_9LAMI|nr:hypothetical protein Salat_1172700 [Sesamum alatum]
MYHTGSQGGSSPLLPSKPPPLCFTATAASLHSHHRRQPLLLPTAVDPSSPALVTATSLSSTTSGLAHRRESPTRRATASKRHRADHLHQYPAASLPSSSFNVQPAAVKIIVTTSIHHHHH